MKIDRQLMKKVIVIVVVLLLLIGGVLVIKKKKMALLNTPLPERAPLSVQVVQPQEGSFPVTSRYLGAIRAKVTADIAPRISGRIFEVRFREGAAVRKGELLAVIDDRTIRDRIEELTARLIAARSALTTQEAIFQRDKRLFENKAISQEQLDRSRTARDLARAEVAAVKSALSSARTDLTYVRLKAPFDGVITGRFQDPGDLAVAGKPVLEMEAPQMGYYVEVKVPQAELPLLKKGSKVFVFNAAEIAQRKTGTRPLELEISRLHPAVTKGTLATIEADTSLRPFSLPTGSTVTVELEKGRCQGIRLPSRVLLENVDSSFVFTVGRDDKVQVHKVSPIYKGPDFVIIERGAIPQGSRVIVAQESALLRLRKGEKVRPIPATGRM